MNKQVKTRSNHQCFFILSFLVVSLISSQNLFGQQINESDRSVRTVVDFDANWSFHLGDVSGGEARRLSMKNWRVLDVPHDWSIEGKVDRENTTGRGGGFFPAGIAWYRKEFSLSKTMEGKRVFIEFDGVMANSQVWVNGHLLGERPNGYVGFSYELTDYLYYGKKENIIAVKADNSPQPASRWYTGSGIYRHVRLVMTNPVHIKQWGVFISTPSLTAEKATIAVKTTIVNQSEMNTEIDVMTTLFDPQGKNVGECTTTQNVTSNASLVVSDELDVLNPDLWGLLNPVMYKAVSQIFKNGQLIDEQVNSFGIRSFHFEAETGFYLNGENMKLKGVCLHHDGGAVGAAVPLSSWELRLSKLKELGVNAIRTAHNPFAPEFYDLCDKMGLLVMNETFDTWRSAKNHAKEGYNRYFDKWWEADTRDVVLRDQNHPSIIIYSVGNEIRDNLTNEQGFSTYKKMQDLIHELDPTRLVTMAIFRPNSSGVYNNGFVEMMDVVGQNYREKELVQAHLDDPKRIVLGTENGHSRGAWIFMRDNPFMSGQFLWTGVDYLGEADWPAISHQFGLLDRTAFDTPRSYQRKSWWNDEPMVHLCRKAYNAGNGPLVSDWTPADHDTYDEAHVEIYSNAEEVEVFLNGKSKGTFVVPDNAAPVYTKFSFEPGTIRVVAKNKGQKVATHEMETSGEPEKIRLTASRSTLANNFDDVVYITAEVLDQKDRLCPNADHLLNFSIEGPGAILAVDNADSKCHIPFPETTKRANAGRCIAIVRATEDLGEITLKVDSNGLSSNSFTLTIQD